MKFRWSLTSLLAIALVAGCHGGAAKSDDGGDDDASKPVAVETVAAHAGQVPVTIEGFGSVIVPPGAQAAVSSATGGKVLQVLVHQGDRVHAGQALAVLQADPTVASDLAKAKIAYQQALRNRDREKALVDAGVAPRMNAQQAESDFEAAAADLALKQRNAALADENTRLVAPIGGVVTECTVTPGVSLAPQTKVMTVSNPQTVWADIALAPDKLARVHTGMRASVTLSDGAAIAGRIVAVDAVIDPNSQRGDVRIALEKASASASPGAFARATITTGAQSGLLIPNAAIVMADGTPGVYVVADGKAHLHPVTLGAHLASDVVAESGIKPGDLVVSKGAYQLTDGAAIAKPGADDKADADDKGKGDDKGDADDKAKAGADDKPKAGDKPASDDKPGADAKAGTEQK